MRTRMLMACFALAACACDKPGANVAAAAGSVVAVDGGSVSGTPEADGGGVWVYRGIPFAAPPLGDKRWRPPQPVAPWTGVRDATRFAPACLQARRPEGSFYGQIVDQMSEDCLYLNVWTAAKPADRAPVMVWIHGGGLTSGHGGEMTYDGAALARRGVVLVSINYRLGPLGYFAHPLLDAESEHHASGNYGTLDQIAALTWVRKNIAHFGGDPARVTIFGESAGSWSVNHLMATPLAKGLFQRAIGESGGGFGSFGTAYPKDEMETAGQAFASALLGPDSTPTIAALRAKSGEAILAAPAGSRRSSPNVDGWVFPDTIYNIFAAGRQNDVPVIVGSNADEGATLGAARAAMSPLEYTKYVRDSYGSLATAVMKLYPASNDAETRSSRVQSYTDERFGWEMRTWARMMRTVSSPARLYFFSRVPPGSDAAENGAFHAAEIIYVFDNLGKSRFPYANRAYTDVDRTLSKTMASYWVNFAKSGDPNGRDLTPWPVYSQTTDEALEFGDSVRVRAGIRKDRLDLMDRVYAIRRQPTN